MKSFSYSRVSLGIMLCAALQLGSTPEVYAAPKSSKDTRAVKNLAKRLRKAETNLAAIGGALNSVYQVIEKMNASVDSISIRLDGIPPGSGVAGPSGATGPIGPMGPMGPIGPVGPMGPGGSDGAQGPQGIAGERGPQGPAGQNGSNGATGQTGPTGLTGPTGATGAPGRDGVVTPNSVNSSHIVDGSIASADLAADALRAEGVFWRSTMEQNCNGTNVTTNIAFLGSTNRRTCFLTQSQGFGHHRCYVFTDQGQYVLGALEFDGVDANNCARSGAECAARCISW